MRTYRAAVIGCGRMGGFIDNEVVGEPGNFPPYSHGGGFYTSERTDLVACSDFRTDLMDAFGQQYEVPAEGQYTDFREMVASEDLDIVSVAVHVEHHAEVVIALAEAGVKAIYCEKGLAPSLGRGECYGRGLQPQWHDTEHGRPETLSPRLPEDEGDPRQRRDRRCPEPGDGLRGGAIRSRLSRRRTCSPI